MMMMLRGRGCRQVLQCSCLPSSSMYFGTQRPLLANPTHTIIRIPKHTSLSIPTMLVPKNEPIDAVADTADDLAAAVLALKHERDTWRAVAESYQKAFEDQTARLQELQNICVATQMELENERTAIRHGKKSSEVSQASLRGGAHRTIDVINDKFDGASFGTAVIYESSCAEVTWRPNVCFQRVECFAAQRDYGTALKEVDCLLRGPLTPQARVDGLLLKSTIMRKSEWLFDALAACSEALELCNHLEELHAHLPRVQYQRGICYYQLQMLKQAREAFNDVCAKDDLLYAEAFEMRECCDDQLHGRRPGFEAHRTVTEGLLYQLYDSRTEVRLLSLYDVALCFALIAVVEAPPCKPAVSIPRCKSEASLLAAEMGACRTKVDVMWYELIRSWRSHTVNGDEA
jgi:hypothetical protein